MDKRKNIENLRVYQDALEFSNLIWTVCIDWDHFAKKTVGEQLVRSADSISANIAEGYGRFHYKENLRFCYYARGSFEEVKDWINKSKTRNLILLENLKKIDEFLEIFPKSLNAYINYIKKSMKDG